MSSMLFDPTPYYPALALIRVPEDPSTTAAGPDADDELGTGFFVTRGGLMLTAAHNLTDRDSNGNPDPHGTPLRWVWVCVYDAATRDWTDARRVDIDPTLIDDNLDAAVVRVPGVTVAAPPRLTVDFRQGDDVVAMGFQPQTGTRSGFYAPWLLCTIPTTWPVAPFQLTHRDREPSLRLGLVTPGQQPMGTGISGGPVFNRRIAGAPAVAIVKAEEFPGRKEMRAPEVKTTALAWLRGTLDALPEGPDIVWDDRTSELPPEVPPRYLEWLKGRCTKVELLGLKQPSGQSVMLRNVYVPLTTLPAAAAHEPEGPSRGVVRGRRGEAPPDDRPQRALLLNRLGESSLYVTGDAGSGKSTFCQWVAWLACEGTMPAADVEPPDGLRETLSPTLLGRLPLLVPGRDFWGAIPTGAAFSTLELEAAIATWIASKDPPGLTQHDAKAHIERGRLLFILDGIDEIPPVQRHVLINALADAVPAWHRREHRLLVTSRPYGLSHNEEARLDLPRAPLQLLDWNTQELLVHRWFTILGEASGTAADLLTEIGRQDYLREFAANPLLLTALCVVYGHGKRLPQDRHELYDEIVNTVLYSRFPVQNDRTRVRRNLAAVAHGMHTGTGLDRLRQVPQAVVTDDEIERILGAWQERRTWTDSNARSLDDSRQELVAHAGLLQARGDQRAAFYHLSFQDFLAAQQITQIERDRLDDLFVERSPRAEWHRTLGFVFGRVLAVGSDPDPAVDLLARLIDRNPGPGLQLVVADAVDVLIKRGIELGSDVRARVAEMWLATMRGAAPARDRCRLGNALALLGDPRFRTDAWSLPDDPLLGFIEVPAGAFRMGSDKQRDSRAFDDEEPAHDVVLPTFYVARFPVTVAQFKAFVSDSGVVPADPAWERGVANHPVVDVSWRDAVAYCAWLTRKLVGWPETPAPLAAALRRVNGPWRVVLPSEAEWEKAARGTDGRVYPYLGEFDPAKGNVGATGIGTTSSVGCFEGGASACGALDMSGNVWEWTRSARANYPYAPGEKRESMTRRATASRGVRGGSFGSRRQGVRAACRSGDHPGNRSPDVGFRVVVSPFFSDL